MIIIIITIIMFIERWLILPYKQVRKFTLDFTILAKSDLQFFFENIDIDKTAQKMFTMTVNQA